MIDTNIEGVDVVELMERVRRKAVAIRTAEQRPSLPPFSEGPSPPTAVLPRPVEWKAEQIGRTIAAAKRATQVTRWIPKFIRGLFRRQGKFNDEILRIIDALAQTNTQLTDRLRHLAACVQVQDDAIQQLAAIRRTDASWMAAVGELAANLAPRVQRIDQELQHVASESSQSSASASTVQREFRAMREELSRAGEHLRNLQAQADGMLAAVAHSAQLQKMVVALEQRITDDGSYMKGELSSYRTLLVQLLDRNTPKSRGSEATDEQRASIEDAFYLSFENRFRGSRSSVSERLAVYLPLVKERNAGSPSSPVIDVGSGRGEWLELLKEHQLVARGVDLSRAMYEQCQARGLDVAHSDALKFLQQQQEGTAGAVTGFHIIEHLPFEVLMDLFAEAYRVLRPGGVAIFESPNCKNLVVGACNFNIDPTHRNPVFPETAEFMLRLRGFEQTKIIYLAPIEGSPFQDGTAASKFLDERLFGPQDFSVIGYKPPG